MSWILVLSLYSNDAGNYVRYFPSEKACVTEMKSFTKKNGDDKNIKYVGCVRADLALNETVD